MAPRKISLQNSSVMWFILGVLACVLAYMLFPSPVHLRYSTPPPEPIPLPNTDNLTHIISDTRPTLDDPYNPPLVYPETQDTLTLLPPPIVLPNSPIVGSLTHQPIHVVPINVRTNGMPVEYRQLGILTRTSSGEREKLILPLMGRSLNNGRDKWQYYTMSNSPGAAQNRLPISVNGRSCTSEYGCDSISNGDVVYVEGYEEIFRATLYETGLFSYLV